MILGERCERDAAAAGFRSFLLGATLPGEPLYRAFGFVEVDRIMVGTPDGVDLECVVMQREIRRVWDLTRPAWRSGLRAA